MTRKLRAALELTPGDWVAVAAGWWVLLAVHLTLKVAAFSTLDRWSERGPSRTRGSRTGRDAAAEVRRWDRGVRIAARLHVVDMSCLRQALALRWLLAMRGVSTELRIGVQKLERGLLAHAWLEFEGVPLGEEGDVGRRYLPLAPLCASR